MANVMFSVQSDPPKKMYVDDSKLIVTKDTATGEVTVFVEGTNITYVVPGLVGEYLWNRFMATAANLDTEAILAST